MNEDDVVFWMVWEPSSGQTMVRHATCREAEHEAKRLARANSGKTFYVLQAVSHFTRDDIRAVVLALDPPF